MTGKLKIIAVIPARFASTRFPGKPLELLKNKPMIQWVYEGACKSKLLQKVYVATDDERIATFCNSLNIDVLMTRTDCPTGTDRIFEATKALDFDVVLNIQGDEPLIDETYIDPLAQAFIDNQKLDMATLAHPLAPEDLNNKNAVKVIINLFDEAIYFSRLPMLSAMKHIGLYGYSRAFLQKFCTSPQALIEKNENLEQLRALFLGAKIKILQIQKPTYGVDTPEDLQRLEALLK